jgi:hypothetical protein
VLKEIFHEISSSNLRMGGHRAHCLAHPNWFIDVGSFLW